MMANSSYSDEQLLILLRNDDETAFTELYNRYHAAIYAYLLDFVKMPQLAEDLVHEVFMKIWEIRRRVEIKTSFTGYLYRVCHNQAVDALKKITTDQKLRVRVIEWLAPGFQEVDEDERNAGHQEALLEKAIAALPPQRQKVFLLCRKEGKTYDQAAEILGISRNTVKEHMVQAFRFLRNYLADNEEMAFILVLMLTREIL